MRVDFPVSRARVDAAQLAQVQALVAVVSDDDLPARDRRTRAETLVLDGQPQTPGANLVYGAGVDVTLVGRGRGQGWWLIAWEEDGLVFHGTAPARRLSLPEGI